MITADQLMSRPSSLMEHLSKLAPGKAAADEKLQAEKAEEAAVYQQIANLPAGTVVKLGELGETRPAKAAKRRAREAGLIARTQKGVTPIWRRTSKGQA